MYSEYNTSTLHNLYISTTFKRVQCEYTCCGAHTLNLYIFVLLYNLVLESYYPIYLRYSSTKYLYLYYSEMYRRFMSYIPAERCSADMDELTGSCPPSVMRQLTSTRIVIGSSSIVLDLRTCGRHELPLNMLDIHQLGIRYCC